MLDPMPRQDLNLPPSMREAQLMAEIERLREGLEWIVIHAPDESTSRYASGVLRHREEG